MESKALNLYIDTFAATSLALYQGEQLIAHWQSSTSGSAARDHLFIQLKNILGSHQPNSLKEIWVSRGPGSFTGLRIGLSLAQALAIPHNIPLKALANLDLLQLAEKSATPLIPARPGFFYTRHIVDTKTIDACYSQQEICDRLPGPQTWICSEATILGIPTDWNLHNLYTMYPWDKIPVLMRTLPQVPAHQISPLYLAEPRIHSAACP